MSVARDNNIYLLCNVTISFVGNKCIEQLKLHYSVMDNIEYVHDMRASHYVAVATALWIFIKRFHKRI